ncbi:MAG: hypothetical protein WC637_00275 [Victivallales bacterium]|jgi:hypothetical protein
METCGTCLFLVDIDDPNEAINECHCAPPKPADNKGLAAYPRVKNAALGCGLWMPKENADGKGKAKKK